ncbi:MAG: ASPIC/UnbV domain-containing protein [Gemmataceae bacterium]|nr:ASPIC/UnbV domain-containing protein [Gemmataceae bacterium]
MWLAVVSQPNDRCAAVPAPGGLDKGLGEFWVGNPWQIVAQGHNLSAFERNRAYLNLGGKGFMEISHLTGADSDGDGRSVVAADFRNIGQLDLLVRQAGGGVLLLYENRLPARNWLKVSLRGKKSNRQGIGARLVATTKGLKQTRELFPYNSFYSQAPSMVHFGLGDAATVDELLIRWPSGKSQVLKGVKANQHLVVEEAGE